MKAIQEKDCPEMSMRTRIKLEKKTVGKKKVNWKGICKENDRKKMVSNINKRTSSWKSESIILRILRKSERMKI